MRSRVGGAAPPPPVAAPLVPRCALLPAATPRTTDASPSILRVGLLRSARVGALASPSLLRVLPAQPGRGRCAPRRQSPLRSYLAPRSFPRRPPALLTPCRPVARGPFARRRCMLARASPWRRAARGDRRGGGGHRPPASRRWRRPNAPQPQASAAAAARQPPQQTASSATDRDARPALRRPAQVVRSARRLIPKGWSAGPLYRTLHGQLAAGSRSAGSSGGSPREGARSEARAEQRLAAGGRRRPRPGWASAEFARMDREASAHRPGYAAPKLVTGSPSGRSSGGSPREGARSELASGAATGGGGRSPRPGWEMAQALRDDYRPSTAR